jgi:hypothetical protein
VKWPRIRRGRGQCHDPPEVVLAVLPRSIAWFTGHPRDSRADLHSSRTTTHSSKCSSSSSLPALLHRSSRWQPGHHSRSVQWGTCATIVERLGTSLRNAISQGRPIHLVLQCLWQTSRGASRRVQHRGLATPTTPPWLRYRWERKFLQVRSSSMCAPSLYCLILELHMIS